MYLSFYGLKREPFQITPDPDFLYLSPSHKEALAAILYGVRQRKGFTAIVGEVGVGKTTILRSFIEEAQDGRSKIVYVFDANVSFLGLLKLIYQELGLVLERDEPFEMVNRLHHYLIDEYHKGNYVILIIDEAQNMPIRTLESLRMLSNLETSTDKLVQIVLIGPPELERKLELRELRQVKGRIAIKAHISPLSPRDSIDYIRHRLAKSAKRNSKIFTDGALRKIIRQAQGIPRTINILCDNALITGFGYQKNKIGIRIMEEVIADLQGTNRFPIIRRRLLYLSVLLLIAVLLWIWVSLFENPIIQFKTDIPLRSLQSRFLIHYD